MNIFHPSSISSQSKSPQLALWQACGTSQSAKMNMRGCLYQTFIPTRPLIMSTWILNCLKDQPWLLQSWTLPAGCIIHRGSAWLPVSRGLASRCRACQGASTWCLSGVIPNPWKSSESLSNKQTNRKSFLILCFLNPVRFPGCVYIIGSSTD